MSHDPKLLVLLGGVAYLFCRLHRPIETGFAVWRHPPLAARALFGPIRGALEWDLVLYELSAISALATGIAGMIQVLPPWQTEMPSETALGLSLAGMLLAGGIVVSVARTIGKR